MSIPSFWKRIVSTATYDVVMKLSSSRRITYVLLGMTVALFFLLRTTRLDKHIEPDRRRSQPNAKNGTYLDKKFAFVPVMKPNRVPDVLSKDRVNSSTIRQIALLGERNSGTTWMTAHLKDCFDYALPVKVTLVRHKIALPAKLTPLINQHWFQSDILEKKRINKTLVVAEFRNPCQWAEAMRVKDYKAPMHHKIDDWYNFVNTPWTMPRREHDVELLEKHIKDNNGVINATAIQCQKHFSYNEINGCLRVPYVEGDRLKKRAKKREKKLKEKGKESDGFSGQEPFYEAMNDGSGRPYSTLMDMRRDKIKNFLGVHEWDWIAAVLPVQYEEMVKKGTYSLIENIEDLTGVKANCTPSPPQDRPQRLLPKEMVEWMTEYVDWETEALIGYEKC